MLPAIAVRCLRVVEASGSSSVASIALLWPPPPPYRSATKSNARPSRVLIPCSAITSSVLFDLLGDERDCVQCLVFSGIAWRVTSLADTHLHIAISHRVCVFASLISNLCLSVTFDRANWTKLSEPHRRRQAANSLAKTSLTGMN